MDDRAANIEVTCGQHVVFSQVNFFYFAILFNDGHVLQLRPETLAVSRWMENGLDDYDGQMVSWDKC